MSKSNASPIKGSTASSSGGPNVQNVQTVASVSNAAFTKLAERGMAGGSNAGSRPGTPASPRPHSPTKALIGGKTPVVTLGVCAMDVKARSKAMREILTRLVEIERGGVDVQIFGDVVILEEGESSYHFKSLQHGHMYHALHDMLLSTPTDVATGRTAASPGSRSDT